MSTAVIIALIWIVGIVLIIILTKFIRKYDGQILTGMMETRVKGTKRFH